MAGEGRPLVLLHGLWCDRSWCVAKQVKDFKVVLIDGERLADLMLRFGVGVTTRETFAVQEIDEDFFTEELG